MVGILLAMFMIDVPLEGLDGAAVFRAAGRGLSAGARAHW